MAKQIKAIKCPHCGSIKASTLRPDYYKCNSCATEFFLDNEDITINVKHTNNPPQTTGSNFAKLIGIIGGLFIIITILIFGGALFSKKNTSNYNAYEKSERWWTQENCFFEADDKTPIFLKIGELTTADKADQPTVAMYDARNGKLIKKMELPVKDVSNVGSDYRIFDDGTPYFIINKSLLYKVNTKEKTIQQVTAADFPKQPLLQSGFAKIEMVDESYGSGFNIMTNDGKQLYYYPISEQLFIGDDGFFKRSERTWQKEKERIKTGYEFSTESSYDKNKSIQLVKYKKYHADGFAKNNLYFSWKKDNLSDKLGLLDQWTKEKSLIISYEDFTPGRLYFGEKLLAYNDRYVLLSFKSSPAEDAKLQLQLMDSNSKIRWTLPAPPTEGSAPVPLACFDGYFSEAGMFITFNYYSLFIGYDGKIIHQFPKN